MSRLYSMTSGHAAVCELARVVRDLTSSPMLTHAICPKEMASIVRIAPDGVRELVPMRWGFPAPTSSEAGLVTSIRNPESHWWKPWLREEQRCLVPVTSFCERLGKPQATYWFALEETCPLFFLAGVWRLWNGKGGQKSLPAEGDHLIFSFLTTESRAESSPLQPKTLPLALLDNAARETWLTGSLEEALALRNSVTDDTFCVVAAGDKQEGPPTTQAA